MNTVQTNEFLYCTYFEAVRVAGAMQEEVTAKRGELDALQNKLVLIVEFPVPKFKKGLGTSVHIIKITSYQKNNPTTRNIT